MIALVASLEIKFKTDKMPAVNRLIMAYLTMLYRQSLLESLVSPRTSCSYRRRESKEVVQRIQTNNHSSRSVAVVRLRPLARNLASRTVQPSSFTMALAMVPRPRTILNQMGSRVTSRPQLSASLTITSSTVRHRNVIIRTETPRKEHRPATAIPSLAKIIWQC